MEQWKDIVDYESYYQVSNLGRIRSVDRMVLNGRQDLKKLKGRILRATLSGGYFQVNLSRNNHRQGIKVHQLVAEGFLGPCPAGQQVRHGPNGKLDNSVPNLCYGTPSQDGLDKRRDGSHTGRPVRRSDGREYINMQVAADELGCSISNIWGVCSGRCKTTKGYSFVYVNDERGKTAGRAVRRSDGKEFTKISLAAKDTECSASNIGEVCRGLRKTTGGFGWEYI